MVLTLNGVERVVWPGGAVFLPAGTARGCASREAEEVEFLCIVSAASDYATE